MRRFVVFLLAISAGANLDADECENAKFSDLAERVRVEGPLSLAGITRDPIDAGEEIVQELRKKMAEGDKVYFISFRTDPSSDDYWGYESLVLVRGDCVVYELFLSHDN